MHQAAVALPCVPCIKLCVHCLLHTGVLVRVERFSCVFACASLCTAARVHACVSRARYVRAHSCKPACVRAMHHLVACAAACARMCAEAARVGGLVSSTSFVASYARTRVICQTNSEEYYATRTYSCDARWA